MTYILRHKFTEKIEVACSVAEYHELLATGNYIFLRCW